MSLIKAEDWKEKDLDQEKLFAFLGKLMLLQKESDKFVVICTSCKGVSLFLTAFCPHCGEKQ